MVLSSFNSEIPKRWPAKGIAAFSIVMVVSLFSLVFGGNSIGQSGTTENGCKGLHAGIRAEVVRRDAPYTESPFVMLSFILLNDADTPLDSSARSWKIVIDGKEQTDSGWIFGNGPQPEHGWGTLNPGESYELGKGLQISKYFPEEREYQVYWKGSGFQSSVVTVKVAPE
jgi:hypothetical protein